MIARTALLIALLAAAPACAQQRPHPAVCRIVVDEAGGRALGSGTLIDARDGFGLVVTNWHVVRDAAGKIEVIFPDGFRSSARPVKLDQTWDLAALVIWRPPAAPVALADTPPRPGDPLTICGYGPGVYRAAVGRCTDYYAPEIGLPHEMVELSVEARQGDSGGPIFNDRGELAGVLFGAGQGTTLGSFQGRVQTFLASVTPTDNAATQVAQGPPPGPRAVLAPPGAIAAKPEENAVALQPPPVAVAVADEPAAPPLAPVTRVAAASTQPKAGPGQGPGSARWFTPSASREAPSVAASPAPTSPVGIDWVEDGRSMMALVGIAAIVAALIRSGG